jgi:hypothetical protein
MAICNSVLSFSILIVALLVRMISSFAFNSYLYSARKSCTFSDVW